MVMLIGSNPDTLKKSEKDTHHETNVYEGHWKCSENNRMLLFLSSYYIIIIMKTIMWFLWDVHCGYYFQEEFLDWALTFSIIIIMLVLQKVCDLLDGSAVVNTELL